MPRDFDTEEMQMAATQEWTHVVRVDDESSQPTVGLVVSWEDDDNVLIAWGDAATTGNPAEHARPEFAEDLLPCKTSRSA